MHSSLLRLALSVGPCNRVPLGLETALELHYLHQSVLLVCATEVLHVGEDVTIPGLVFVAVESRPVLTVGGVRQPTRRLPAWCS